MSSKNISTAAEFFLLGFYELGRLNILLFILVLPVSSLTLLLNITVITLVSTRQCLQSPMYFFLKNLLGSEIFILNLIVPNMLRVIWLEGAPISIPVCIAQSYLYCGSGSTECYLLTTMAYDRYLAICRPLHYNSIMNGRLRYFLVIFCWVYGFVLTLITLSLLAQLEFCDRYTIDHYFCDLAPFSQLACSDSSSFEIGVTILSVPILVIPSLLVLLSYICIFATILGMSSITGRKKAFSTCSSHLLVVGISSGTSIFTYMVPVKIKSFTTNKIISVMYVIVTPLFSPIIYCIRNQDIRNVMRTLM